MQHNSNHELYHEIFGSVLDRTKMTPYLLSGAEGYKSALARATKMMGNRGFDTLEGDEFHESEKKRAQAYVEQVYKYFFYSMSPFVKNHLSKLESLHSVSSGLYRNCLHDIAGKRGESDRA
jgi:hypothetical protein